MNIHCLIYEGVNLLDVAGPAQVFATAAQLSSDVEVAFRTYSLDGGTVMSDAAVALSSEKLKGATEDADITLVPGSAGIHAHIANPDLTTAIADKAKTSKLVASVCTGSLLLAQAGLLTHKKAATHWRFVDLLRQSGQDVLVNEDAIFVEDGSIWTSAGVSSGIDMSLALVERFCGRALALRVAKELVVPMVRSGGQKQYSTELALQSSGDQFGPLYVWISDNLNADLRVDRLADRCGMSARNFARRHVATTGLTPAKMVERLRVERCLSLLETSDATIKEIAHVCGFATVDAARLAVLRSKGVGPSQYRAQFGLGNRAR
ncbi:MAG: DJ-1/PfpI family protein [Pseudomonadota bacterium]